MGESGLVTREQWKTLQSIPIQLGGAARARVTAVANAPMNMHAGQGPITEAGF